MLSKMILPKTDNPSIVLITGDELRHQRFAYRIQEDFGGLVLAWYQVSSRPWFGDTPSPRGRLLVLIRKIRGASSAGGHSRDILNYVKREGLVPSIQKAASVCGTLLSIAYYLLKARRKQEREEARLFGEEVLELKKRASLTPTIIANPNSQELLDTIRKLSPYFLLSLGGAWYGKELLESIRGVAINQHAGWSPTYKGTGTIYWALYHRNLDCVGSTLHIITTGLDSGPILHRSHPCIVNSDTPESCFARVVALGTELMIESVRDIIANPEISVEEQPKGAGKTYLASQLNWDIRRAVYKDFADYWLEQELARIRTF